ncbi:hypothetical protein [Mucilaginibacter pedocola]|uniref:Lipoprotein n=1 Tax=Mucilaginibacter pedocola TaxID=1792845 RepID=A0A1S9P643_9SPHI|nr:hypothetical protein [Mucilaginibacter pedocola]OOQ56423.1 hypothetical protein BC343_18405 [Mucilaginibacter pedocola]
MKLLGNFKTFILLACVAGLLLACGTQLPIANLSKQQKVPLQKMLNMLPPDSARQSFIIVYKSVEHGDTTGTRDFAAIVYDKASAQRYFFLNESPNKYNVIKQAEKTKAFIGLDNLLNYYLAGKTGLLQPLAGSALSRQNSALPRIYDIDFAKHISQVFELPSVTL